MADNVPAKVSARIRIFDSRQWCGRSFLPSSRGCTVEMGDMRITNRIEG